MVRWVRGHPWWKGDPRQVQLIAARFQLGQRRGRPVELLDSRWRGSHRLIESLPWRQQEIKQGRLLTVAGGQRCGRPAGDQRAPAARDRLSLAGGDLGRSRQLVEDAVWRRQPDLLARHIDTLTT